MHRKPSAVGARLFKPPAVRKSQQELERLRTAHNLVQALREAGYSCELTDGGPLPVRKNEIGIPGGLMKSSVVKHSIQLQRHKTSISLEDQFWNDLKKIAIDQRVTLSELVTTIDDTRAHGNLSSAIRMSVLNHFRSQKWMDDGVPVALEKQQGLPPRSQR